MPIKFGSGGGGSKSLTFKLLMDTSGARSAMASFGSSLQSAGATWTKAVGGIAAAVTGVTGTLFTLAKTASDFGSAIHDASQKVSIHAEALSSLKFAADQSSSSFEAITGGLERFEKNLDAAAEGGGKKLTAAFKEIGINAKTGIKDPEAAFGAFLQKFATLKEDGERTALAIKFFGKSGAELIPTFLTVGGSLEAFKQKCKELGVTISDEVAAKADDFGDKFDTLAARLRGVATQFGVAVMPLFIRAMDSLNDFISRLQPYAQQLSAVLVPAINALVDAFTSLPQSIQIGVGAFAVMAGVIGPLAIAVGALVTVVAEASAPMLAAFAAISVAVGLLAAAWSSNFLGIRDTTAKVITEVVDFQREHLAQLVAWYKENLPLIKQTVQTVLEGMRAFWAAHGEQITAVVSAAWSVIKQVIKAGTDVILGVVRFTMQVINEDWAGAWDTFAKVAGQAANATNAIMLGLGKLLVAALRLAVSLLLDLGAEIERRMQNLGIAIVQGIINGVKSKANELKEEVKTVALVAKIAAEAALGIHSPSLVFYEIGQQVVDGFINALRDGQARAQAAMRALVTPRLTAKQAVQAANTAQSRAETQHNEDVGEATRAFDASKLTDTAYVDAQIKAEERLLNSRRAVTTAERAEANATIKNRTDLLLKLDELRARDEQMTAEYRAKIQSINDAADARAKAAAEAHRQKLEELQSLRDAREIEELNRMVEAGATTRALAEERIQEIRDGAYAREIKALEGERAAHAGNIAAWQSYTDEIAILNEKRAESAEDATRRINAAINSENAYRLPDAPAGTGKSGPWVDPKDTPETPPPPDFGPHLTAIHGFKDAATSAFNGIAQGFGSMLQAFLDGGEISGRAFLKMAKSVIAGIAAQATVKAIFELAEGWAALANPLTAWQAPFHFAAAKIYGLVAAVSAGVALAIPGGSKSSSADAGSSSSSGYSTGNSAGSYATSGDGKPRDQRFDYNTTPESASEANRQGSRSAFAGGPVAMVDRLTERLARLEDTIVRTGYAQTKLIMQSNKEQMKLVGSALVQNTQALKTITTADPNALFKKAISDNPRDVYYAWHEGFVFHPTFFDDKVLGRFGW